jgi:hypothetical protein
MKRIVRYGILQGATFIITLTAISYWISGNDFFTSLTFGIIGGLIVGILNSLLFYKYAVPKYILDAVSVDLDADETIMFQTPANFTSGQEPISGKLFLTNKRLIFKNHKHDKNIHEFSIDLIDITKVGKFKTLQLFENGLCIDTVSTLKHKFIVDRLKQWLLHLDTKENGLQQAYCQ